VAFCLAFNGYTDKFRRLEKRALQLVVRTVNFVRAATSPGDASSLKPLTRSRREIGQVTILRYRLELVEGVIQLLLQFRIKLVAMSIQPSHPLSQGVLSIFMTQLAQVGEIRKMG
jgi:hypothetical protein